MNTSATKYTAELASFAANTTLASIPSSVLTLLPVFILDTFAAMLAGSVQPVYRSAVEGVKLTYGTGVSQNGTYLALDGTATCLSGQMFLLGLAAADFEFEHVVANAHPASAMFPALLAVAAAHHKSGSALLTAMAVGYELAARIGATSTAGVESVRGFHNPGLNGALATAAAVGNLLGWDAHTIASAMGIAASSSAGLLAFVNTGAMTKRLHPARAGQLGAEAALLAHAGVVGPADVLENSEGYMHAFSPAPQFSLLTADLGTKWTGAQMILKLAPVHARAQAFVYAINRFRNNSSPSSAPWTNATQLANVTVHAGPAVLTPRNWITAPNSLVSAQYSVPFGIAAALSVNLGADPLLMNDALVGDAGVLALARGMKKVQVSNDSTDLGGYVTLDVLGEQQGVRIVVDGYPGLPGAEGYVDAVWSKFDAMVGALGVSGSRNNGSVSVLVSDVRDQIANVAELDDVAELLAGMVGVGTVAVERYFGGIKK